MFRWSPTLFLVVKIFGAAYLVWLGIRFILTPPGFGKADAAAVSAPHKHVLAGIAISLTNPKAYLFFGAFLPQFAGSTPEMLSLSAVFMAVTFAVFAVYGLCAAAVRTHVISRPAVMTWMRRTFAAAFVALGARLAFTSR